MRQVQSSSFGLFGRIQEIQSSVLLVKPKVPGLVLNNESFTFTLCIYLCSCLIEIVFGIQTLVFRWSEVQNFKVREVRFSEISGFHSNYSISCTDLFTS